MSTSICDYPVCSAPAECYLPGRLHPERLCGEHTMGACRPARPLDLGPATVEQLARDGEFGRWATDWAADRLADGSVRARRDVEREAGVHDRTTTDTEVDVRSFRSALLGHLTARIDEELLYEGTQWANLERQHRRKAAERFAGRADLAESARSAVVGARP